MTYLLAILDWLFHLLGGDIGIISLETSLLDILLAFFSLFFPGLAV